MTLEEIGNEYLEEAESIRNRITGLRPLLEIYRDDELNSLKSKIWVLYRLGKNYFETGKRILNMSI